jgi:hypothetical protein
MRKILLLVVTTIIGLIPAAAHAQNINSWTRQSLKDRFGTTHVKYVGGKIKTITFGPTKHFHGDLCFNLIVEVLRGPSDVPSPNVGYPDLEITNDYTVYIDHKTGIVINQLQGFVFVAVKGSDITNGSVVLTGHLVDDEEGSWFVLEIKG